MGAPREAPDYFAQAAKLRELAVAARESARVLEQEAFRVEMKAIVKARMGVDASTAQKAVSP
jgi:hypothetical protein